MAAPSLFLEPNMMQTVLLYAFAAAVLGGMDSPLGAVVGGLVLGVLLNLVGTYVDWVGGELRLAARSRSSSACCSCGPPVSSAARR